MRVVVDGRLLDIRKTGGTEYSRQLLRYAAEQAPQDEFLIIRATESDAVPLPNVCPIVVSEARLGNSHWEQLEWPLLLRRLAPDVLLSFTTITPVIRCCPAVVVAYDLGFLLHPEFHQSALRQQLREWAVPSLQRADQVVCLSETVRRELRQVLDIPDRQLPTEQEPASPHRCLCAHDRADRATLAAGVDRSTGSG